MTRPSKPTLANGKNNVYLVLLTGPLKMVDANFEAVYKIKSESELKRYIDAAREVEEWTISDSFSLVARTFEDFIGTYKRIETAFTQTPAPRPEEVRLDLNSDFLSFLSMFRFYIDSTNTRITRLNSPSSKAERESFEKALSDEYDSSFTYRFCYQLRNYAQHCGFPITGYRATGTMNKETGQNDYSFETYLERDKLLENYDWKKLTDDLKSQPKKIQVYDLANEFIECLKRIEAKALKTYLPRLKEQAADLNFLLGKAKVRKGTPYIGTFPATFPIKPESDQVFANANFRPLPLKSLAIINSIQDS